MNLDLEVIIMEALLDLVNVKHYEGFDDNSTLLSFCIVLLNLDLCDAALSRIG